jgi:hypothetical protein
MPELGRPTLLTPELLEKAKKFLDLYQDTNDETGKVNVKFPSLGALARYLKVSRDTIHEWSKHNEAFSDIYNEIMAEQEQRLINNGLAGKYQPAITALILSKHGYKKESDITTGGEKINMPTIFLPQRDGMETTSETDTSSS